MGVRWFPLLVHLGTLTITVVCASGRLSARTQSPVEFADKWRRFVIALCRAAALRLS